MHWIHILSASKMVSLLFPPRLLYHFMSLNISKYTMVVIALRSFLSMAFLMLARWLLNLEMSHESMSVFGESDSDAMRSWTAIMILSVL